MSDKKYTIKEAANEVQVETHVLRYWEEELDMRIKRNEMGHRYYEENDIKLLKKVKELKDRGIQLKAIRELVSKIYEAIEKQSEGQAVEQAEEQDTYDFASEFVNEGIDVIKKRDRDGQVVDFKVAQFQTMMNKVVSNSIKENMKPLSRAVSEAAVEDIMKQMDVLIKEKEEREEARYRKLDSVIREMQQARQEIAAASVDKKGKRRRKKLFSGQSL